MDDKTLTELLNEWSAGDPKALDKLVPRILDEVRDLARAALAHESPQHTLQPTELVNEVYLRLFDRQTFTWKSRVQFFGLLAQLVRRVLVEHARHRRAAKRGDGVKPLPLDEKMSRPELHPDLIALNDALEDLKAIDEEKYQIVMLRFFVGLTQEEIAQELGVCVNTVGNHWKVAQRWLRREIDRASSVEE